MRTTKNVRFLTQAAMIAALYAVLTYAAAAVNLAYGAVQFRFSEALTVLPVFTPAAIPGLAVGCFLANLGSPLGLVDWIFGTGATLLAAMGTWMARKIQIKGVPVLAPLPPVIANVVLVGFELSCLSSAGTFALGNFTWAAFGASALSVGIGELVICYALGLPLLLALRKTGASQRLFSLSELHPLKKTPPAWMPGRWRSFLSSGVTSPPGWRRWGPTGLRSPPGRTPPLPRLPSRGPR